MRFPVFFFLGAVLLIFPFLLYAHGFGKTLSAQVGEYLVDVDYDAFTLQAGEPVRFTFNLWDKARAKRIEITGLWTRIAPKGGFGVVFAGQLGVPGFSSPGMTYVFPRAGEYELSVRFQNGEKSLAEAAFPLSVEKGSEENKGFSFSFEFFIGAIAGLFGGFLLSLPLWKKKR